MNTCKLNYEQSDNNLGKLEIRDVCLYFKVFVNRKEAFELYHELVGAAYEIAEGMGWSGFEAKTQEILHLIECENNEDLR